MNDSLVRYEIRDGCAVITMNRPERRNALSRALIQQLITAFERARQDPSVRVIVLTGAGPAFCAGMDLSELEAAIDAEAADVWTDALTLARLFELIYTAPQPTLAVVHGAAVAGGAGLVSVCDLALAAPEARFGYPEVRRGLVAALVMPHLLRLVGERMARWLLLSGELIDAEAAVRCGLINAVVPAANLDATSRQWVRWLADGGPQALASTKDLLRQFSRQALSVEEAAQASAAPRVTDECRQGLRAFFRKHPAPWQT